MCRYDIHLTGVTLKVILGVSNDTSISIRMIMIIIIIIIIIMIIILIITIIRQEVCTNTRYCTFACAY